MSTKMYVACKSMAVK